MPINIATTSNNLIPQARYSTISPDNVVTDHVVDMSNHWSYAWYSMGGSSRRKGEIFHVGGGNAYVTETAHVLDYGTYNLIPDNDFYAMVHMWGAGGSNYNSGNSGARGGGGGFTQGLVLFKSNISYALVIGEAGKYNQGTATTTHGGGGGSGTINTGGQGGGLSGIFYNSNTRGRSVWNHNAPVRQSQALLIAGGGGGAGHHGSTTHLGQGGGGGGWSGLSAHNSGPGGQWYGGWGNPYSSIYQQSGHALHGGRSTNQSWVGGGGGGWFGGGGGAFDGTNNHNGGSGGSGHHAMKDSYGIMPNNRLAEFVIWANTETSPSSRTSSWAFCANVKNPLAYQSINPTSGEYDGSYAGKGGHGSTENTGRSGARHGKIIITLMPQLVPQKYFQSRQVSHPNNMEWGMQNDYIED